MPAIERIIAAAPAIAAGGKVITSPFQFYSDGTENLRLRIWSSLVTNVGLQGRWLRASNGEVHPFRYDFPTTADRLPFETNLAVDAGYMLNCSIGILGGAVTAVGQTFVQLALVRGRGDAAVEVGTILQGYVATSHWIGFPGSPIQHSFEGPGFIRQSTAAAPAPGNQLVLTVPEHTRWRLMAIETGMTTSAVVANRYVALEFSQGFANPLIRVGSLDTHPAGVGRGYSFGCNIPYSFNLALQLMNIPIPTPYYLRGLDVIRMRTFFIDIGDQWAGANYMSEEWLDTDIFGAPL